MKAEYSLRKWSGFALIWFIRYNLKLYLSENTTNLVMGQEGIVSLLLAINKERSLLIYQLVQ